MTAPLILINAVGLTPRLLQHAPRLSALGTPISLSEVVPSVTMSAQATLLTGEPVDRHGIVGNGWLFRDTNEVRFWQQSNRLIQAQPLYATARRVAKKRGRTFTCAKLFWWFNQGADVDISITPKPHYGIDGSKVFGITGTPDGYTEELEQKLGKFPFHTFWGPMAGLPCTDWIARCAAEVLTAKKPDLTLVYLPHLDYDPQRKGPSGCDMPRLVRELDDACAPLIDAAKTVGARVWIVSEYGHCDVSRPVYLNRALREAGLLTVRRGPFGEQLETFMSRAFAVCDHQVAHVYVRDPNDVERVRDVLAKLPGVAQLLAGDERSAVGLTHERAGELVALSDRNAWFAYPFWLDDRLAPDYARAVAIHHKPGYDPCELFLDPKLTFPKMRIARRLLQKKLGFRMTLDVVPLDASLMRGSHGLPAADAQDGPLLIGAGADIETLPMTAVRDRILAALDLVE
ncbi:MAG TPA: nucleotide pyrophosphatase/phosphodiesterase family protein [Gemmataceae bacterium]|jgi:predicted AlkP superfamily pyrophosphatase or phosphodiesterase|nr:nucleotide pyrophosphatase/phosphodiesterase family protein [Gemmataceae bacterium]